MTTQPKERSVKGQSAADVMNSIKAVEKGNYILLGFSNVPEADSDFLVQEKIVKIGDKGFKLDLPYGTYLTKFQLFDRHFIILEDGTRFIGPKENTTPIYLVKWSDANEKTFDKIRCMIEERNSAAVENPDVKISVKMRN